MRGVARFLFIVGFLLIMSGCGSQSPSPPGGNPPSAGMVSLTVTDTPPAGVTVLFFQLGVTGATLTSQSGGSVSLLPGSTTIPVNVSQLQTDSAFLGSASVAAATYTGMGLTFANPQLTIYNGSGATIGSGANACANDTVGQLTPSTTPLTLTLSSAPFPVTLSSSSPLAFKLDIHLNTVIQPDLTVNLAATNGVTVSLLPAPTTGQPVSSLAGLLGTIVGNTTTGFMIQTGDGRTFSIGANSSTIYNFPTSICADNFSCVTWQPPPIVKAVVSLQTDGTLLASQVTYMQPAGQTVVEGNIIRLSTSGGNTLMDIILQQGPSTPATTLLPFGRRVTVSVPPTGVTYAVDSEGFDLPYDTSEFPEGVSFAGISDLQLGQQVAVVVSGSVTANGSTPGFTSITGPAGITFSTNSITLEPTQITGTVAAVSAGTLSFTLSTLPNYFLPPAATPTAPPIPAPVSLTIQTSPATTYVNFSPDSISGLAVNDVVTIKGWVFSTPGGTPNVAVQAESVINRPGPTPLF